MGDGRARRIARAELKAERKAARARRRQHIERKYFARPEQPPEPKP